MAQRAIIFVGLAAIAGASFASDHSHYWSYFGKTGPAHWAELDRTFSACSMGKQQSPINIQTKSVHSAALPPLEFNYKPGALHIVDNGHTIQANIDPGSFLAFGKDRYELIQLHFHHPSEERVNGKSFDMEAHLVHRDAKGNLAVVAVFLNSGKESAMIETLWQHLPSKKEREASPKGVHIDPAALIPQNQSYFTYIGSLTTPPCSEGVRWLVLKSPRTLSKEEIATFTAHYPNDARPIQPLNHRDVLTTM